VTAVAPLRLKPDEGVGDGAVDTNRSPVLELAIGELKEYVTLVPAST